MAVCTKASIDGEGPHCEGRQFGGSCPCAELVADLRKTCRRKQREFESSVRWRLLRIVNCLEVCTICRSLATNQVITIEQVK